MKIIATIIIGAGLLACASATAWASQEQAEATVQRFLEQTRASKGISYHFTHAGSGALATPFPPTAGTVEVIPATDGKALYESLRISATSQVGDQQRRIEVVADSEWVRSLDEANRRVLIAPKWRNAVELVNFQYLIPLALVPELASAAPQKLRFEGERLVDGVRCIVVGADTRMANLTLLFGLEDGLLYGGEARKPEAWGEATIQMSFREQRLDRQFDPAQFQLSLPDGYSEFAYSGDLPAIGQAAPDFRLTGFDGSELSAGQLKGQVVILDFWATWCGPCKQAMPGLQQLHERHAQRGLRVIGVNFGEVAEDAELGLAAARDYLKHYDFSYDFAYPSDGSIAEHYKPNLPMAVVIDREGRIAEIYSGYFGEESDQRLEQMVMSLL